MSRMPGAPPTNQLMPHQMIRPGLVGAPPSMGPGMPPLPQQPNTAPQGSSQAPTAPPPGVNVSNSMNPYPTGMPQSLGQHMPPVGAPMMPQSAAMPPQGAPMPPHGMVMHNASSMSQTNPIISQSPLTPVMSQASMSHAAPMIAQEAPSMSQATPMPSQTMSQSGPMVSQGIQGVQATAAPPHMSQSGPSDRSANQPQMGAAMPGMPPTNANAMPGAAPPVMVPQPGPLMPQSALPPVPQSATPQPGAPVTSQPGQAPMMPHAAPPMGPGMMPGSQGSLPSGPGPLPPAGLPYPRPMMMSAQGHMMPQGQMPPSAQMMQHGVPGGGHVMPQQPAQQQPNMPMNYPPLPNQNNVPPQGDSSQS